MQGVYQDKRKDGSLYYRSSITFRSKHISLGSFEEEAAANAAYLQAEKLLYGNTPLKDYFPQSSLAFAKWVSLINYRDNGVYFAAPIYLRKKYFLYYLEPELVLTFDAEDLFFYARHSIQKRGGRLFFAEYGMQTTLKSRYGLKPYAVAGRDYIFVNGNEYDFRYENIHILSKYNGVIPVRVKNNPSVLKFRSRLHIRGNFTIGTFEDEIRAAVAYNKACDYARDRGINRNFGQNYVEELSAKDYAELYLALDISDFCKHLDKYIENRILC